MKKRFRITLICLITILGLFSATLLINELFIFLKLYNGTQWTIKSILISMVMLILGTPSLIFNIKILLFNQGIDKSENEILDYNISGKALKMKIDNFLLLGNLIFGVWVALYCIYGFINFLLKDNLNLATSILGLCILFAIFYLGVMLIIYGWKWRKIIKGISNKNGQSSD